MKAIFLCVFENGIPDLPPMDAETGDQLHYEEGGELRGGYSMVNEVPGVVPTCLVLVDASPAVISAMMADTTRYPMSEVCNA